MTETRNVLIMGAAGRDFHDFNVRYRDNPHYRVCAFTANQIPNISGRRYPPELAGYLYPQGIPIYPESQLESLIAQDDIQDVILAYSDISHETVMHLASRVLAAGADFGLPGPQSTMLHAKVPVISVCAVRTGCGKSQTTRRVTALLRQKGRQVVVVRHPMPYGDLAAQASQRFATYKDLTTHNCTIEEREEYEPHLAQGTVVYAGVDYARILASAEAEADVIVWDGGNNDLPFFCPDLHIVVTDPLRPGHETRYHPGETNLRRADAVVINKIEAADPDDVATVRQNISEANPRAVVIEAASPISVDTPGLITGHRVLVIEDGPTVTHGEMPYGAGLVAAKQYRAKAIVDPRPYAVGAIADTFERYPSTGPVLPAMGYGDSQIRDLRDTIAATPCDAVLVATPVDLRRLMAIEQPTVRVSYELVELGSPDLGEIVSAFLRDVSA